MDCKMKELIGSKVLDVEVSDDEYYLKFTTDKGIFTYLADGDCCSESWFSEILNLDFLVGHTVSDVEEVVLPEYGQNDGHCRQESDIFYGFKLSTEAGNIDIVFRNSSNGYYGGSYSLCDKIQITAKFTSIKHLSDWTAYEVTRESYVNILKMKAFL